MTQLREDKDMETIETHVNKDAPVGVQNKLDGGHIVTSAAPGDTDDTSSGDDAEFSVDDPDLDSDADNGGDQSDKAPTEEE